MVKKGVEVLVGVEECERKGGGGRVCERVGGDVEWCAVVEEVGGGGRGGEWWKGWGV